MCSKLVFVVSFILLAVSAGSVLAGDIVWTNGSGDGLWNNANNWSPSAVPAKAKYDKAKILKVAPHDVHINAGMDANCQWLVIGDWESGGLHMTGGTLNVSGLLPLSDSWTIVAYAPPDVGIFTMDGGTVTTSNRFFVGFMGNGTLNMNGGTMNIGSTFGIGYGGGTTGRGTVNLAGGTINVAGESGLLMSFPTGSVGLLDITGGTLTINGDKRTVIEGYIANGWITAHEGAATVMQDFNNISLGKTTVWASAPTKARLPSPTNGAVNVNIVLTDLSWTGIIGANSHNVYFGTANPPAFAGNQTETTFDPGQLESNTTYYWRIDEVNGPNIVTGALWSFTTVSNFAIVGFSDNFNDGIINDFWLSFNPIPGAQITETNGTLKISVPNNINTWWADAGLRSATIYPLQSFECSVDFRVPQGYTTEAHLAAQAYPSGVWWLSYDHPYDYGIWYVNEDWPDGQWEWCRNAFWNENTVWHKLKMTYDAHNMTSSAYVDDIFLNSKTMDLTNFRIEVSMRAGDWMTAPLTVEFDNFKCVSETGNIAPLASFIYSQGELTVGENIIFDASTSHDSDGTIVSYEWDFGDGNTASGQVANHSYIQTGQYAVTLTVMDNNGLSDSAQLNIVIKSLVAEDPDPADGTGNAVLNKVLRWTAGSGAVSHNVYFGTSSPPAFAGNQTATTFDPGILDFNTTYYWRIDEVSDSNTTTGDLWTFTTTDGLAKNPNPANGAMSIPLNKILRWTAGYGTASHDVYLGTSQSDVTNAERPAGDLDKNGRVDYNDLFVLANYWLQDPAGSVPYAGVNGDNIVDFYDYALLAKNWMGQASSYFKGNVTEPNYDDPCNFALNTTYYWRIDEISGSETRKGNVWSFTTTTTDSNYSLVGKIMCGYQGWFNTPTDGAGRGWVHWGSGGFSPTNCTVDMWPDMNEMGEGEKYAATEFYDGNDYYVFSSHNRDTVLRHFQWMQQYGIDGVYLQRFATDIRDRSNPSFYHRNDVLSYCKDGANLYDKKYAIMYDLTGLGANETSYVKEDWKFLVDTMGVGRDANDLGYMFHKGKPVVAIWGIGFPGRAYAHQECYNLVNFLKNDPCYGGNIVVIGVNDDWRTNPDTWVQQTAAMADIISPWTGGRYDSNTVASWVSSNWGPDKTWCDNNGKEYLPVIWPGFSWHNLKGGPLNQHPRNGGQFLWDQVYSTVVTVDVNMIYVAMFDEVDEGTAIFKVTNNPPTVSPAQFVTYRQDLPPPAGGSGILPAGAELPSDEYLWLVGQAGRALRGEIPVTTTRPARP